MIIFAMVFTSINAYEESFPFIGVSISTETVDLKPASASSQKETTGTLRYGQQTLDWRTTFAISGNKNFQTFSLEIDKILLDNMFGMPEIRPYLGATIGYIDYKHNTLIPNNGLYYGGNFGFIIYATDSIDADVSYHYYTFDKLDPLNKMEGGSIGFNFFY